MTELFLCNKQKTYRFYNLQLGRHLLVLLPMDTLNLTIILFWESYELGYCLEIELVPTSYLETSFINC